MDHAEVYRYSSDGFLNKRTVEAASERVQRQFGVTHHDILYNKKEDKVYCVLDAPSKQAVAEHHKHAGIQCEWIHEVESTRK